MTGILFEDVQQNLRNNLIPMIECESLNQAQWIHDQNIIDCNYIYIQPPSVEELSNRIIRNRPGLETKESLNLKMSKAVSEMEKA